MQNYATVVPLSRRSSRKYPYASLRYRQFQLRDITLHIARMLKVACSGMSKVNAMLVR